MPILCPSRQVGGACEGKLSFGFAAVPPAVSGPYMAGQLVSTTISYKS